MGKIELYDHMDDLSDELHGISETTDMKTRFY